MCHHHPDRTSERAASLEHGEAHDQDHDTWTRRDFLLRTGLGTAAAVTLGSTQAYALDGGTLLGRLAALDTDRVLVLIQLAGGNDGLNTIVPVRNDIYYNARPDIALRAQDTVALSDDFGLHAGLAPLSTMWSEGQMSVIHGVGYDDSSLSHFYATDVWSTARPSPTRRDGGWVGGTLRTAFPDYEEALPEHPPAVQIGANNPLLFQSGESDLSMRLANAELIDRIVSGGGLFDPDDVPATAWGSELGFVRAISNASNTYIGAVQVAGSEGVNAVEYPNHGLADSLAAVARLIKGGLRSRIYLVSLGGFDTHSNQLSRHQVLMDRLGGAVAAFQSDLASSGDDERVLTMTFSEFGRRVAQNGSAGTDHGTAAPLFAFGPVEGGFFGAVPDLGVLNQTGNVSYSVDFRSVYAAALGSWLGLDPASLAAVLGGSYDPIAFVSPSGGVSNQPASGGDLFLGLPSPNPVRTLAQVPFRLASPQHVRLQAFDVRGRLVSQLEDRPFPSGSHSTRFDASDLPAGVYVIRMIAGGETRTAQVTVAR